MKVFALLVVALVGVQGVSLSGINDNNHHVCNHAQRKSECLGALHEFHCTWDTIMNAGFQCRFTGDGFGTNGEPTPAPVIQPTPIALWDEEGPDDSNMEDIQEEINLTPSILVTKDTLWRASYPRYDDPKLGSVVKEFTTEQAARDWVYKHTGAHRSINYPMPEGIFPADSVLERDESGDPNINDTIN